MYEHNGQNITLQNSSEDLSDSKHAHDLLYTPTKLGVLYVHVSAYNGEKTLEDDLMVQVDAAIPNGDFGEFLTVFF